MRHIMRTILILTAALLGSNGYATRRPLEPNIVEKAWQITTMEGDKRTAQQIFNEDISVINKITTDEDVETITRAIRKIINKISSHLSFGAMNAKNQKIIKRALLLLEYTTSTLNPAIFIQKDTKDEAGNLLFRTPQATMEELKPLANDKSLTKKIKSKLQSLISAAFQNNE